ncbi:NADH-quinone oxidoreductase cyanobacterial subunit N [Synechococcus sp. PCC 7502]|uniref:NAD(P)H-quinone oxidoreductase subunit N n=1 Tax=Synechococcus sp. PCC 7502 TaxID=1173263 RepID=UPI00029FF7C6|nr:NAD(P)H-quinone oxidoreductase subunit N [Synechococcus sp. PCC 7502]AFY74920.1 NADH-quinone oxidoreductase cyanobacterial subunit N [Synechococcus sp. PCC 7502]
MALIAGNKIVNDLEAAGALAMYVPPEGGYEGRYQRRVRNAGYDILSITARGLGDVSSFLTGVHGVRPSHLGKKAIVTYFLPPKIQYRLASLPPNSKGLVVWLGEGKFLTRQELEVISQIPAKFKNVKVVIELGSAREVIWSPLVQAIAA